MNNTILAFTITFLAGFATIFGIIPCFFKENNKDKIISGSLSFSAGVMITISIISLIPEATTLLNETFKPYPTFIICAIFIVGGIIISSIIDSKIEEKLNKSSLYKLGIISAIVLMLHNIPEGITTFISTTTNKALGLKLAFAIALHNIPEGISIAVPIYFSTKNKRKTFFYTIIAGFSELFGAIIAYIFLQKYINNFILSIILAMTAGIMIDISIYELLPSAFKYKKNKINVFYFVLGILIMLFSEMYLFN